MQTGTEVFACNPHHVTRRKALVARHCPDRRNGGALTGCGGARVICGPRAGSLSPLSPRYRPGIANGSFHAVIGWLTHSSVFGMAAIGHSNEITTDISSIYQEKW
jgi:hypothetical protein